MTEKNPYLFDNNIQRTPRQIVAIKNNNIYLFTLFNHLFKNLGDVNKTKVNIPDFMTYTITGRLPYDDTITGHDTHDLAKKIKFLICELEKPEVREKFNKSFFYSIINRIFCNDASWIKWNDYKIKENVELPKYLSKSYADALPSAFSIYVNDVNTNKIGLDFSTLIDTIVTKDKNGNYIVEGNTENKVIEQLADAVRYQIDILKDNPTFKKLYRNINENEIALYDNDEKENG